MSRRPLAKRLIAPKADQLTPQQIKQWRDYIESVIGFILPDDQRRWLVNAIETTAKSCQLSLDALWRGVQNDSDLRQTLLDEVLIVESRFFRHPPSLDFITKLASTHQNHAKSPLLFQDISISAAPMISAAPFRIWSLGCSNGQEVWSLAMSLKAHSVDNFTILGTDVSQKALIQAKAAQYDNRQQRFIPEPFQAFVEPISQDQMNTNLEITPSWQVNPALWSHVHFSWHNIFEHDLPIDAPQDVIICQNVLIYFRKFDQRDILNRLSKACRIGGHIVLAPGEGSGWRPKNMKKLRHPLVNAWQKINNEP